MPERLGGDSAEAGELTYPKHQNLPDGAIMTVPRSRPPRPIAPGLGLFAAALLASALIAPLAAPAASGTSGTVEVRISAATDDVEELLTGYIDVGSSDLELVDEQVSQQVGLRFQGLDIPAGAVITGAWVQFTVDEPSIDPATLIFAADDVGNALTFGGPRTVSTRVLTAGSVSWEPAPWPTVGVAGPDQRTPDLAPVIQEVVARPDWAAGNAIALIVTGTGRRTAESFDGSPQSPPLLHVEWALAPGTTTTGPTTTTTAQPTTTTTAGTTTTTAGGGMTQTADIRVAAGIDDAEQLATGFLDIASSDLELVDEKVPQLVGLRFTGLGAPPGATITAAWVQFTVDETSAGPTALTIAAHDVGDAPNFAGGAIGLLPRTVESVAWAPPPWITLGTAGPDQRTPGLSALLQAIIDRPDWSAGNAVALILTGSGTRTAWSFDGFPARAPLLHVEWTTGGTPGTTTTVVGTTTTTSVPVTTTTFATSTTFATTTTTAPPVTTTTGGPNQPPQVIATVLPVVAGGETTLEARVTDDGLPTPPGTTTVLWEQIDGPTVVTIADPAAFITHAVLPDPGEYRFRVTVDDGELTTERITVGLAEPAPAGVTRLAVIGDYGDGQQKEASVAEMIALWDPDAVVTVGDNVYWHTGFDRLVGRYYHRFIGAYNGIEGEGSPVNRFFPSLGNHDYEDAGLPAYLEFFTLPGTGVDGTGTSGNERYYDAVVGDVHLFILNSNPQEPDGVTHTSVQGAWLQQAMGQSTARWQVVVFHHSSRSSIPGKSAQWMRWPFAEWGADLLLVGDAHVYERLVIDGLPMFISGLGVNNSVLDGPLAPETGFFYSEDDAGALFVVACVNAIEVEYRTIGLGLIDTHAIGTGSC